ncbi:MAG TPA: GNAT family N-acetyltransferase [Kribbellaceae bacterium]
MGELRLAHTAELDDATLAAVRALLEGVFDGDFSDEDWDHSLGGIHAMVWDKGELVGHGCVVQRRLLYDGRALRAGYVEGVGVRADRRRHGYASAMMTELEQVIRDAYDVGALSVTEDSEPLYAARGWQLWRGPSSALTPDGVVPTPDDDGGIYVLPLNLPLDVMAPLTCDYRNGDLW